MNTVACVRRDSCRLCGSKDIELVMKCKPTPLADAYIFEDKLNTKQDVFPLDLFLCKKCSLVQLADCVDPEVIYEEYVYRTVTSPGLVNHFNRYCDSVIKCVNPNKGALVVEIGSNDGTLLNFFKSKGMRVLGIDPARAIAKKAAESGIETLPEFFNIDLARKIKKEKGSADIIIANNVIANIDNLDELIKSIHELLAPCGVFVFETGYLVGLIENMVFDNIYHEHLCYYSVMALDSFFKNNNMELINVVREPTKGGSLRGFVQFKEGLRPVSGRVKELIDFEKKLGVDKSGAYKDFAAKINSEKEKLLKLLEDLKAKGKTIVGYGASHSVTTFIHHFDIGKMLDFIVDDNSLKQNTFSPGYHIPVFASQEIYKRKPDYILILAWRFYEAIINKHRAFLKNGGHFIVPLPEFKVI